MVSNRKLCLVNFPHCIILPLIYSVLFPIQPSPVSSLLGILLFILLTFFHIILKTAVFSFFPTLCSSFILPINCVALVQSCFFFFFFIWGVFFRLLYPPFYDCPKSGKFQPCGRWFTFWPSLWCSVLLREQGADALNLFFKSPPWPAMEPRNSRKIN